ncbi:MAG: hypothetical protein ACXWF8_10700 [Methylobacter sp.]
MSGCASIISQSSWPVAIKSTPETTAFTITNQKGEKIHSGTTPATVNLASGAGFFDGESYTVHFTKAGYQDKTATLNASVNGWYWGNFAFGGILGLLIIDPATGAMFRLPESFNVDLTANISSMGPTSTGQRIISLNDIPQELRNELVPVK